MTGKIQVRQSVTVMLCWPEQAVRDISTLQYIISFGHVAYDQTMSWALQGDHWIHYAEQALPFSIYQGKWIPYMGARWNFRRQRTSTVQISKLGVTTQSTHQHAALAISSVYKTTNNNGNKAKGTTENPIERPRPTEFDLCQSPELCCWRSSAISAQQASMTTGKPLQQS